MSTLKHKGNGPQALTANGLKTGPVVYLTEKYQWSTAFSDALITEDADLITKMKTVGDKAEANNFVVGVYFIDVDARTGRPVRYRENFRANGPSYDPGNPSHDSFVPTFVGG